jgi:hypothetical protein
MSGLTFGKAMVLSVLGASLVVAWPASAQATTSVPASAHASHHASTARPNDLVEVFTGHTYPDTAAGLAACQAEGKIYQQSGAGVPYCWLGEPDAGLYGLWMIRTIP